MPRRKDSSARRAVGARLAAWLGMLALLVQALLPAAAMAATSRASSGETIAICTVEGVRTVTLGEHEKGGKSFAGLPCHDCLAASCAALPAREPQIDRVAYARLVVERPRELAWAPKLARPPPRPPGQGPPAA